MMMNDINGIKDPDLYDLEAYNQAIDRLKEIDHRQPLNHFESKSKKIKFPDHFP